MSIAIITGANSGLGLHLVKSLYSSGIYSTIVMACRSKRKAEQAIDEVKRRQSTFTTSLKFIPLDLTSKMSVAQFVEEFSSLYSPRCLNLLVNNAGIMGHPYELVEGIEIHFVTSHLGHFQLTNLLLEKDSFADNSRILIITSGFYEKCKTLLSIEELKSMEAKMSPNAYYSHSKFANCLHTMELAKILMKTATKTNDEEQKAKKEIKVVAIRPGFVAGTNLGRYTNPILRWLATPLIWFIAKSLDQGISSMLHCSNCPFTELKNGALYYDKQSIAYNEFVNDENSKKLWEISEKLLSP